MFSINRKASILEEPSCPLASSSHIAQPRIVHCVERFTPSLIESPMQLILLGSDGDRLTDFDKYFISSNAPITLLIFGLVS